MSSSSVTSPPQRRPSAVGHASKQFSPKKFPIPTPQSLANIALYYLARFAATEAGLRRVLENRLRRAAMSHPDFAADHARQALLKQEIDKIIAAHRATGAVNDAAYADMKVGSLRRSGRSQRIITQKLKQKGVADSVIATALQPDADQDAAELELQAALRLAKRRRLGPFRTTPTTDDRRRKDIAAMARAGFAFAVIKQVLGGEVEEDLGFDG
jgi:regulatory protein